MTASSSALSTARANESACCRWSVLCHHLMVPAKKAPSSLSSTSSTFLNDIQIRRILNLDDWLTCCPNSCDATSDKSTRPRRLGIMTPSLSRSISPPAGTGSIHENPCVPPSVPVATSRCAIPLPTHLPLKYLRCCERP